MKSCADLYSSLADYLHASRKECKTFEEAAKEIIPGVDYKATLTLQHKRKKVVNDGDVPEVCLNARDKFCISTFCIITDNLKAEMSSRGQVYNDITDRFSCLVNVPETSSTKERVQYSLVNVPETSSTNERVQYSLVNVPETSSTNERVQYSLVNVPETSSTNERVQYSLVNVPETSSTKERVQYSLVNVPETSSTKERVQYSLVNVPETSSTNERVQYSLVNVPETSSTNERVHYSLVNVPETSSTKERVQYSECCEELLNAYPVAPKVIYLLSFSGFTHIFAISLEQQNHGMPYSVMQNTIK